MTEVQEKIFGCLRKVAEFANNNRHEGLQAAIDKAEEVAISEVLGVDVNAPIEMDEYALFMKEVMPYFGQERA